MKAYKVEVLVLDFENYGKEQIDLMLGDVRGLSCSVRGIEEADIGEWTDEHPLNHRSTSDQEFKRLFPVLQLEAQQAGDVALKEAVAKFIKAKGRFHTEQNYTALVAAYDAIAQGRKA
jgi:hypothetical protein